MVSSGWRHMYVKAPAMPPPAAPIRARSRTKRVLRRAWVWGFKVGVGFKEVEAKERSSSHYFWLIFF